MNWTAFEAEVSRILRTSYRVPELTGATSLEEVDSLGLVEIITAAEEHLGIQLEFGSVRKCATYHALTLLIESEAASE